MASVHRIVTYTCPACQHSTTGPYEDACIGEQWYCAKCYAFLEIGADGAQIEIPPAAMSIDEALTQQVYRKRYCPCVLQTVGESAGIIAVMYVDLYGQICEDCAPVCMLPLLGGHNDET
jgi:hypothetical protein